MLILALAPAIGLGMARFAYGLVLPDMRISLGWSFAEAGFMNSANAAGYLIGAVGSLTATRRVDARVLILLGSLGCVVAMAVSAATSNFAVLSLARLAAGIGGALAFVAGGTLAAAIAERHPAHASFLFSLFCAGPGVGLFVSGGTIPMLMDSAGPGSWWIAWGVLAGISAVLMIPLAAVGKAPPVQRKAGRSGGSELWRMLPLLAGYLCFGAGYIAYMTFMVAWTRAEGAGPELQTAFASLLGVGGICAPWLWSPLIARLRGGSGAAALMAVSLVAAVLPLASPLPPVLLLSAFFFGSALFAVVAAVTAFIGRNLASGSWALGIGAATTAFSIGQTAGPLLAGLLADLLADLAQALMLSAGALAAGVVLSAAQRDFHGPKPFKRSV